MGRYLANLFIYQTNRYAIFAMRDFVLKGLEPVLNNTSNKHVKVAVTSLFLNIAIVLHESSPPPKSWDAECARLLTRLALAFLEKADRDDGTAQHRALLAIGTLLPRDRENGGDIKNQCVSMGLRAKLMGLEVDAKVVEELGRFLS